MRYILLALLLTGCAVEGKRELVVDNELYPYLMSFKTEADSRRIYPDYGNMVLRLADNLQYPTIGKCSFGKSGPPTIAIDRATYQYFTDYNMIYDIESLVFHELGHCLLRKIHGDGIMNSIHLNGETYKQNREQYLNVFFGG